MVYMASNIDEWLPESGKPNIEMILCVVFFVNLLSATQTIVVDGWALTMLKKWVGQRRRSFGLKRREVLQFKKMSNVSGKGAVNRPTA